MTPESPFNEEIYPEWERLILADKRTLQDGRQPQPEQISGWQALYAKARENGAWRVSASDASLVALLGVTIALQEYRFGDAADLAKEYLDHPDAAKGDAVSWDEASARYGVALILSGRMLQGIAEIQKVLQTIRPSPDGQRHTVRNQLLPALADLGNDEIPDTRLASFVGLMLQDWEGQDGKADLARRASSHRRLIQILESTYPSRP